MNFTDKVLNQIIEVAKAAGAHILQIYESQNIDVATKEDGSPLTRADREASDMIIGQLKKIWPDIPVISEEAALTPYSERKSWDEFFLVDPLDGTKEFVKKTGEFTVNIAYLKKGRPVAGVVYCPPLDVVYYAQEGQGAYKEKDGNRQKIQASDASVVNRIVVSRSHMSVETESYVKKLTGGRKVSQKAAGSSLKMCLIAEGQADLYPRLGPTSEWDTAAADIVVFESGGSLLNFENGKPLDYNKESFLNPYFVAAGRNFSGTK